MWVLHQGAICCRPTLLHVLYCHKTSSLRFSIHSHVNCALHREISALLVLREACPCSTCWTTQRGCPFNHQPPTCTQQYRKNLYTTETKHRDIELYIDLRALSLWSAHLILLSLAIITPTLTQSWNFEDKVRGLTKVSFCTTVPSPLLICLQGMAPLSLNLWHHRRSRWCLRSIIARGQNLASLSGVLSVFRLCERDLVSVLCGAEESHLWCMVK